MRRFDRGPETERLILRAATVDDADAMFELCTDPDVMRHVAEPMPSSVEDMRNNIEAYPDFEKHGFGRWLCELKDNGEVIGFAGLKYLEDLEVVDLGYRFRTAYWGRGFATEASRASVEFGFETLGLDYLIGLVLPENVGSIRVLEKVGLTLEGPFEYDGERCLRYGHRRHP